MKKSNLFTKIIAIILWLIIIVGVIVIIYVSLEGKKIIDATPELDITRFENANSTVIYDINQNKITEEGLYFRENIEFDDMPISLVDAFLAIEDSRFFEHNGFDIPRFSKALIENLKSMSFGQGGSTFTMQLVKNSYFQIDDGENSTMASKSIDRKVQEIYLALKTEEILSKEEIFTYYLNKLNFGGRIRGIEKASEYYFDKHVSELNLQESAILAGIINAPNAYNPYSNLELCTERRNDVINLMLYHGYITDEEAKLALSIKVEDSLKMSNLIFKSNNSYYNSYIDVVNNEVYELTGKDPAYYPMEIHTYMDPEVQKEIYKIQNRENPEIIFNRDNMESAIVSMNNQNGAVVGIGGGMSQDGQRVLNRATQSYMQPGSSIKPILDYALAFEYLGYNTMHTINDHPITYRGTNIQINNFSGSFQGDITLMDALAKSLNVPAILLLQEVTDTIGSQAVVDYLHNIGFDKVEKDRYNLGYAIGGSDLIVSPIQLAAAHAMLINNGVYNEPHTIDYILIDGEKIYGKNDSKQVISPEAAYLTTTLENYAVNGPYKYNLEVLRDKDYQTYGKTGTSDWGKGGMQYGIPEGAARDYWMAASNAKYTNMVWLGFDSAIEGGHTYFTTSEDFRLNLRGKISSYMLDILSEDEDIPYEITKPDGITNITFTLGTFPYAEYVGIGQKTTGLIAKDNASLSSIYSGTPNTELIGLTGNFYDDGTVNIIADGMPFVDPESGKTVQLLEDGKYGDVFFNYGWVLGGPHFSGVLKVNNEYELPFYSDTALAYVWLDPFTTYSLSACGMYYYDNGSTSEQKCVTIK